MAMTLAQAAYLSNDILQKGVIERLIYQDPLLDKLQFKDIKGNGLTYNVETTLSTAKFYSVNETWTESTAVTTPTTAVTTILGGDADVDRFLEATRSDVNDLMAEQIASKVRAIKHAYMNMFYYGYYNAGAGADSKGFDGLHYLISSVTTGYYNTVTVGATSVPLVTLSMSSLEQAVDLIKTGNPDLMVMSKLMRREINQYFHSVGGITYADIANARVQTIYGAPVAVSDEISDNEDCTKAYGAGYGFDYTMGTTYTATTSAAAGTSIFVMRLAPEAVCGIQSLPITVENLGSLETKDAERVRIKWYPGLMLQSIISASKVSGIATVTQAVAA